MKAERRHQLQDNELAKHLETFPETLKRHANTIMLTITVIILVFVFYRYRQNTATAKQSELIQALTVARERPAQLRNTDIDLVNNLPADQVAIRRSTAVQSINGAIETILRDADGDNAQSMRAEALVAKGNLNWALANLTTLPGAATQPTLRLQRSADEYLTAAQEAYGDVARSYPQQTLSWVTAELGLAAIAENRHDWDTARQAYTAVASNADVPEVYKRQASGRIQILPMIQKPALLTAYPPGSTTAPSAKPTTQSHTATPTTAPNVAPTTQPATMPS